MNRIRQVIFVELFFILFAESSLNAMTSAQISLDYTFTTPHIPEEIPVWTPKETFTTINLFPLQLQNPPEVQRFIEQFQEQNSKFIDVLIDPKLQLPYDAIYVTKDGKVEYQGGYTTATEIGFWLVYLTDIAKEDIKVSNISPDEALSRLKTALKSIQNLEKWNGFLYKYHFKTGAIDYMACIYDNGNFAASLGVVIGAFADEKDPKKKEIANLAQDILNSMKPGFQALYDKRKKLLWGNYKMDHHLDILGSEGRLGALMSIVVGDVPEVVWKNLGYRVKTYTLSDDREVEIMPPYEGAFQLYFPLMFVPEDEFSEDFAKAHNNYASVQIDYANKTNLPAFRSACASPYQPYRYTYVPGVGIPNASIAGISRDDIGATHAIAFLNLIDPEKAMKLFQELEKFTQGKIWGPYGMFDSAGKNGEVSRVYISLDHLAMLISMAGKANQNYFVNFLRHAGKLDLVKTLYQEINLGIREKAELPEVKEFSIPLPPEEKLPQRRFTLIDFEYGRTSDFVAGLGRFDGPGEGDYVSEDISGGRLIINYRTTKYNGVWIDLIGLESLDKYKSIFLDLKSSRGMNALKIELKGNKGGWIHYYIKDIGRDWKTYEIPINRFEVAPWEKKFSLGEIPTQLVITFDGLQLSSGQREGILYVDNIMIETK